MVSRCIATIDQERGRVYSLAVMNNKKQFVSASAAHVCPNRDFVYSWSIKLWDIETRQCVRTFANFSQGCESDCCLLTLDDESFVCHFFDIGVLVLYNIASDNYVKIIELGDGVRYSYSLAILDRNRFLTGSYNGDDVNMKVWGFNTGECQSTLHLEEEDSPGVFSISKFDDESFLCGFHHKLLLCDVETGEVMKSFEVDGETDQIAVVDSERFLTVQHLYQASTMCMCTKVNVWNANSGECIQIAFSDSLVQQAIPVRGRGVLLLHNNDINMELRVDEMKNLKRRFLGHTDDVRSMEVVNSTTFISGSEDGTIKVWDLSSWPDLRTLIFLRKLVKLGRAEKVSDVHRSKRLRDGGYKKPVCHEVLPSLEALVCETPDDIFRTVLSFLA